MRPSDERDRIGIAILALGGQGGGVLADWILDVAAHNGFIAQGTSVPGVAQRTGATIYYVEMAKVRAGSNQGPPILSVMPSPGDVDVVIASELMEAGRAMVRGLVTADRTALITSTHRIYAISEKAALGDGRVSNDAVLDAAARRAQRFIGFDMENAAESAGSVISSVMFGALAASGTLPFSREQFEAAIRKGGKATEANLRGFAVGFDRATATARRSHEQADAVPEPRSERGRQLRDRILDRLPPAAQPIALQGAAKLVDYQDASYADLYLHRLEQLKAVDDGSDGWRLTATAARHLALWMAYEDTIRVAELKVRSTRRKRIEREARLKPDQVLVVTEYMHPRLQEICDTLPAPIGRYVLGSAWLRNRLERVFSRGWHVRTTGLWWNLGLAFIGGLRTMRRGTLRYAEEQARIDAWLGLATELASTDIALAAEVVESQELIKGYGETFERGLAQFNQIMEAARYISRQPKGAVRLKALRSAAMADDEGNAFRKAMAAE